MNNNKLKRAGLIFALVTATVAFALPRLSFAEGASDAAYTSAVKQLRADGFKGVDKALTSFESIIAQDQSFILAYISAADAYLLKYEFSKKKNKAWLEKADFLLSFAIEKDNNSSVAYFKRAITRFTMTKGGQGVRDVKKAIDLKPAMIEARFSLGRSLTQATDMYEQGKIDRGKPLMFKITPTLTMQVSHENYEADIDKIWDVYYKLVTARKQIIASSQAGSKPAKVVKKKKRTVSRIEAMRMEDKKSAAGYARRFYGMVIQTTVGAFTGGLFGTIGYNAANKAVEQMFPEQKNLSSTQYGGQQGAGSSGYSGQGGAGNETPQY